MSRDNLGRPKFGLLDGFVTDYDTCKTQFADWRIPPTGMTSGLLNDSANKPSTISWTASNIAVISSIQSDGSNLPGFAITVPTSGMSIKGAYYNIEMKLSTDAWGTNQSFQIYQPSSGDPVLNVSPVIGGLTYNFRVRGVSSLGTKGDWSNEVSKAAVGDLVAPAAPTGLAATGLIKSILLTWNANTELDLRHYAIYRGTSSLPTVRIAYANSTSYIDSDVSVGVTYYYRIKAIDYSGNASGYSDEDSATPSNTMADDLAKTMQPFVSNIKFYPDASYPTSKVNWDAGTIKFADEDTQSIDSGSKSSLTAGTIYYLYFTLGSSTLSSTTTYSYCVSDTKALICVVSVAGDSSSMGIFPVNSKLPLINADMIAANAIEAIHIQADAITANKILNVGSEATSGARIQMTQSTFRVYTSSSTDVDNYYPLEINTSGLTVYTPGSYPQTSVFEVTTAGTVKIKANDILQMYNGTTKIGHLYTDSAWSGIVSESGKGVVLKQVGSGEKVHIEADGDITNVAVGDVSAYGATVNIGYKSGATVYPYIAITADKVTITNNATLILSGKTSTTAGAMWYSSGHIYFYNGSATKQLQEVA